MDVLKTEQKYLGSNLNYKRSCCNNTRVLYRVGVEDTRLEAKAKDTKKIRGQGQAFPSTDTLEAKDRNARGQGQGPRTQAQVLSNKKKRSSQKFFKRSQNSAVLEPRTGQFSRT